MALITKLLQEIPPESLLYFVAENQDMLEGRAHLSIGLLKEINRLEQAEKQLTLKARHYQQLIQRIDQEDKADFRTWTLKDIEEVFNLKQSEPFEQLTGWPTSTLDLSGHETSSLSILQDEISAQVDNRDTQSLVNLFILPLIHLVNYKYPPHYRPYLSRLLKEDIRQVWLRDWVTYMRSEEETNYQAPYVFLYTPQSEEVITDQPLRQVLLSMLLDRHEPPSEEPIYGVYIVKEKWFFILLESQTYAVSAPYDARQDDIFQIYRILKQMKHSLERS